MAFATPALGGETAAASVRAALTRRERDTAGTTMAALLLVATMFTLLILVTLLARLFTEAGPYLIDRGLSFGTEPIGSDPDSIGVWSGLYGSIGIGILVILVAIPMGIAAAVYLEEYASTRNRMTQIILVNIRNLAGVPAVIYGVLGFIIFVKWLKPVTFGDSVIAAGLTMAVLVLPIVVITSMEAIRAVPQGLRDGGFGVGASRWEVTRDHVLPYAAPGILTGTVLSLARALGEAAPLIIVGAITGLPARDVDQRQVHRPADPDLLVDGTPTTPRLGVQLRRSGRRRRCDAAGVGDVLQHLGDPAAQPVRAETDRLMNQTTTRLALPPIGYVWTSRTTPLPPTAVGGHGHRSNRSSDLTDVSVLYGDFRAVQGATHVDPPARDHRLHRTVRVWQDHDPAMPEPDERLHRDRQGRRHDRRYHGVDLYDPAVNSTEVRRRIGMVFQKPNPFPKSIYDNVAYGPRLIGAKKKAELDEIVERSLRGRRPVGRGQGPAQGVGAQPVRRPAAAAVHRPRHRGRARRDPDGRAVLGARPDRHGSGSRS